MIKRLLLAALLATSAQCALAQSLVAPQADAQAASTQGSATTSFMYGWNGATLDRVRAGVVIDALGATGMLTIQNYGFNGTNWDRFRVVGGVANVGTGVGRMQIEEGYSSVLNMTAATQVKASAGRAFKISVVTAGAVGQLCDTTTACAAANVVATIPAAVGVYDVNWPFATGIRYEPGAAQVSAITFQ